MIYGSTSTVEWTEEAPEPFVLTVNSGTVTQPDGTTAALTPSVDPTGESTKVVAYAAFQWTQAGPHSIAWDLSAGSQRVTRIAPYFVAWSDLYTPLRGRLRQKPMELPDSIIDPELNWMARTIADRFKELGNAGGYSALTGQDRGRMDEALCCLLTVRMKKWIDRRRHASDPEATRVQQGDTSYQWQPPPRPLIGNNQTPPKDPLIEQATEALSYVTPIAIGAQNRLAAFSVFETPSQSEGLRVRGQIPALYTWVLNLVQHPIGAPKLVW